MSFWSFTLMMTRLGPSARSPGASARSAVSTRKMRNMPSFLLGFGPLSRGNCRRVRAFADAIPARTPSTEGGKRHVKEPDLEHGEERHRDPLAVLDGEPDEVGEVKRERHFGQGQKRFERHVFAGTPRLGFALDPVLRGAGKIRFMIEDRFQDGAGIIDRETNAEGEERGQEEDFLHPGARMKFALRAYVKDRNGDGGRQEDRHVEEQGSDPGVLRSTGGRMEEHAEAGE